jgi:hypothetical protein
MFARTREIAGGVFAVLIGLVLAHGAAAQVREPPRQETRGVLKAVDASAGTITVTVGGGREAPLENTYSLAKNVEIATASSTGRFGVFKEAKLADLSPGVLLSLSLSADQKTVESIAAEGPTLRGPLVNVDLAKNVLTISRQDFREGRSEDKACVLAPRAEVAIDDGRGRRYSLRAGKPAELVAGSVVTARLSLDQKEIVSIVAEGPTLFGTVKSVDGAKNSLTLTLRPARGDDAAEEKTVTLAADAGVLLDDGKGRRLSLKEAKLADVPTGSSASVRLAVDQTLAVLVRAEGPTLAALLKSVDAAKGTITVSLPRGRGDAPEEKTLAVSEDARINIDGKEAKLASLVPGENGPILQIRMSLDQKSVQSIIARQPGGR